MHSTFLLYHPCAFRIAHHIGIAMTHQKSSFKPSPFATIERSGSVSVKLNEFLGSPAGKSQLNNMKLVRDVAERAGKASPLDTSKK